MLQSFVFHSSRISLKCLTQNHQGTLQIVFLQDVSYTNLIVAGSRSRIETGGWSHHDGFALVVEFLQTPAAELF